MSTGVAMLQQLDEPEPTVTLDELWVEEMLTELGRSIVCESRHHHLDDAVVVDHGGPARYWVTGPCRHTSGYRCEPSVLSAMANPRGICEQCRSSWPRTAFIFRRLDL